LQQDTRKWYNKKVNWRKMTDSTETTQSMPAGFDPATGIAYTTPPDMKYLIMRQSMVKDFLHGDGHGDEHLTCTDVYSIYDISCIKISSTLYNSFRPMWTGKCIEVDKDTAYYGASFFSEIRPVAKVWEASQDHYAGVKTPVTITPEMTAMTLDFMNKFAKMIIEVEFDDRYHEMVDTSILERESWEIQKHEAREYLDNPTTAITPFLDYISEEKELSKEDMSNKILQKAEKYSDDLSAMLVKMQKLLKEFASATTIWDMNILYEKYLGVLMPTNQAIQLGLTVSDTDWSRKVEVKAHEFGF
jgi:hypothetical protein